MTASQFTFQEVLKTGVQNVHPSPERLGFFKLVCFPHLFWQSLEKTTDLLNLLADRPSLTFSINSFRTGISSRTEGGVSLKAKLFKTSASLHKGMGKADKKMWLMREL